jgi:hypothetical protein
MPNSTKGDGEPQEFATEDAITLELAHRLVSVLAHTPKP